MSRECLNIDRHDLEARERRAANGRLWDFLWESIVADNYGSSELCLCAALVGRTNELQAGLSLDPAR